jgi:hypothetical protein
LVLGGLKEALKAIGPRRPGVSGCELFPQLLLMAVTPLRQGSLYGGREIGWV